MLQVEVFWFVTPCSVVVGYICCLHLQGEVAGMAYTDARTGRGCSPALTAVPLLPRFLLASGTSPDLYLYQYTPYRPAASGTQHFSATLTEVFRAFPQL